MKKQTHEFTLYLEGPSKITHALEDALYEAGCADAVLGKQNGSLFITFMRRTPTLLDAVVSAMKQIESALPGVRVSGMKLSPFLTQSELAKLMGVSREYVRLLSSGKRGNGTFPAPVISSEKRLYWDISNVLEWYAQFTMLKDSAKLRRAKDIVTLFLALEIRNNQDEYRGALRILRELKSIKQ